MKALHETYQSLLKVLQAANEATEITAPGTPPAAYLQSGLEQLARAALKLHTAANSSSSSSSSATAAGAECFMISRHIEGLPMTTTPTSVEAKTVERYANMTPEGGVDSVKEERQQKFREWMQTRLDEPTNRHKFTLAWNEASGDVCEQLKSVGGPKDREQLDEEEKKREKEMECEAANNRDKKEPAATAAKPASFFDKYDDEFKAYLCSFNAVLVGRLRALIAKRLVSPLHANAGAGTESTLTSAQIDELALCHEVARHSHKLAALRHAQLECAPIHAHEQVQRFGKLVAGAMRHDHYPIFLYGSQLSGKTSSLVHFGMLAYTQITSGGAGAEPAAATALSSPSSPTALAASTSTMTTTTTSSSSSCQLVVRFCELTSTSSQLHTLLHSLCAQLAVIQRQLQPTQPLGECRVHARPDTVNQLCEYFFKVCEQIVRPGKCQLLILLDDVQDEIVERTSGLGGVGGDLALTTAQSNQISWLFHRPLPAGVHLIVAVKRQNAGAHAATISPTNTLHLHSSERVTTSAAVGPGSVALFELG